MSLNNATHIREANSCPFEFICLMKALKYAEKLAGELHVKPNSIVADENDSFVVPIFVADFNTCRVARLVEPNCGELRK